jgi:hypothetical protein
MPYPDTMAARSLGILLTLISCVLHVAHGQSSSVAATLGVGATLGDGGAALLLRLSGIREGDLSVDTSLRVGAGAAAMGVAWRYARPFGVVGNVVIEGSGDLLLDLAGDAPSPLGRASLGVRGVVGPVAAQLRLDGGSVDEERLDPVARADAPRALLGTPEGSWDVGARASLTYRPDRTVTLTVDPRLRWLAGAWSGSGGASYRRAGAIAPELDLWLGIEGGGSDGRVAAAIGAGTILTRRREPDTALRAWLGHDGERFLPGAELLLAQRSGATSFSLSAAVTPHRVDALPWRVSGEVATAGAGAATWRMRAGVAGGEGHHRFAVALGVERPLPTLRGR